MMSSDGWIDLSWIPVSYIYVVASVLATTLCGLGGFVIKKAIDSMRTEWRGAMDKLATIEDTTRIQAENHLHTIQDEAKKQTALLETLVKEQTEMRVGQAETNGSLKTLIEVIQQQKS